jgi:hypothetical protein
MIKCKACPNGAVQPIAVCGDTMAGRCLDCGTGHILNTRDMDPKLVHEIAELILVDWDVVIA